MEPPRSGIWALNRIISICGDTVWVKNRADSQTRVIRGARIELALECLQKRGLEAKLPAHSTFKQVKRNKTTRCSFPVRASKGLQKNSQEDTEAFVWMYFGKNGMAIYVKWNWRLFSWLICMPESTKLFSSSTLNSDTVCTSASVLVSNDAQLVFVNNCV